MIWVGLAGTVVGLALVAWWWARRAPDDRVTLAWLDAHVRERRNND